MSHAFHGPWLKVKRANKHLADLHELLLAFSNSDFHAVRIERDHGTNFIYFDVDITKFPLDDCALIMGDALHNLRSALDLLWYQAVLACGGTPSAWTSFPIFDDEGVLAAKMNEALGQKRVNLPVYNMILSSVRPHQTGNLLLWGLHALNIADKHLILIPVLKLVGFFGVALTDEHGGKVGRDYYLMDESSRIKLGDAYGKTVTVKHKGKASANILFDIEAPAFQGAAVFPTLRAISEEVTRTIEAFERVLGESGHDRSGL